MKLCEGKNPVHCRLDTVKHPHDAWTGLSGLMSLNLTKFLDSRQMKALRTGRFNPPGDTTGNHFCYKLSRLQVYSAAWRFKALQNSSDSFGNQTRDLPACSAVPQTTAPPFTRCHLVKKNPHLVSHSDHLFWKYLCRTSGITRLYTESIDSSHIFYSGVTLHPIFTTVHGVFFPPWPHFFLHCHVGIFLLEHTEQFIFSPTRMCETKTELPV
jgi:hypothetical protein